MSEGFLPETQHAPLVETMQGAAYNLSPARLFPFARRAATGPEVEYPHTLPPGTFLNTAPSILNASYRGEASKRAPAAMPEGEWVCSCDTGKAGEPASALNEISAPFLGERAVARETVKKAAPAFRRYDGEH
jgi:hypothetical protein